MSLLASIRRNWTRPSPALPSAREMMVAASASPSARTTAACRSCSDCSVVEECQQTELYFERRKGGRRTRSTMNLARSASVRDQYETRRRQRRQRHIF